MTDNEIIKFIEHAINSAKDEDGFKEIYWKKLEYILNIINRQKEKIKEFDEKLVIQQGLIDCQKAEIERLKGFNENLQTGNTALSNEILEIKSEAIKEFAERLKDEMRLEDDCRYDCMNCLYECKGYVPLIDNLVKEMTEV